MQVLNVDEKLWSSSMLPEGTVERWYVADRTAVIEGQLIAAIRVEDALHDIVAPTAGRILIIAAATSMIEPGSAIATLET